MMKVKQLSWVLACLVIIIDIEDCYGLIPVSTVTNGSAKRPITSFRGETLATRYTHTPQLTVVPSMDAENANRQDRDNGKVKLSSAAQWHAQRRKKMLASENGDKLRELEQNSSNPIAILSLLALCNLSQLFLSVQCAHWSLATIFVTAFCFGSICSLWQMQILHDNIHGNIWNGRSRWLSRSTWQEIILFVGSMPSIFGYYYYLKFGHLTHHKNVGSSDTSLQQAFESPAKTLEDGDLMFVAHRMKMKGPVGPQLMGKVVSISRSSFAQWKEDQGVHNIILFASSSLLERIVLVCNDIAVAVSGRNYFFPNKPKQFHDSCARYARAATLVRGALLFMGGWKSLLYLYLSETLWTIPPHPAAAMFVTNHGSSMDGADGDCVPTSSVYAGNWYSLLTLNTNYHCEHHDFPKIPLHQLHKVRHLAPDFYRTESDDDNVFDILGKAFENPDYYACLDVGISSIE